MVNGGSESAGQPTAAAGLPAAVQPHSSVVAVPPELSKLLQRPAKQSTVERERPEESGKQQESEEQPQAEQQPEAAAGQQRRRKQRQPRAASSGSSSSSSSKCSSKKAQRRFIAPKSQGLLAWYDDAVVAAEQAYKQAGRGKPAAAPSLGKALGKPIQVGGVLMHFAGFSGQGSWHSSERHVPRLHLRPLRSTGILYYPAHSIQPHLSHPSLPHLPSPSLVPQGWLDERLEYMGFEQRTFPPLAPLGLPAHEAAQQQAAATAFDAGAARSCSSSGCGSMLSHVFAEWAQEEEGGGLPVLASQWHDVPGRCAVGLRSKLMAVLANPGRR